MILVGAGNGYIRKNVRQKSSIQAIEPTLSSKHVQITDGLSFCLLNPSNNGERSGGSRISQWEQSAPEERGRQPIILQNVCRKLNEYERNWTKRGRASLAPPLDPPLEQLENKRPVH